MTKIYFKLNRISIAISAHAYIFSRVHLDSEFIVAVLAFQQIQVVWRRRNQILWLVMSWIDNFLWVVLVTYTVKVYYWCSASLALLPTTPALTTTLATPPPPLCPSWPCLLPSAPGPDSTGRQRQRKFSDLSFT